VRTLACGTIRSPIGICTIITCRPNEVMAPLHNRMPVILDPADYDRRLDPTQPVAWGHGSST
jgi:putative SOS response-associated peptidase YedK